ncbi:amidohydrolase family protein [Teichococcus cervicalis]|uniref:Amidohydrolase family protein n=1 Tax=Pseudoroseomonas cervicalis ATCC 49957 TaxID=525371 RepID=D5RMT0_9PROT|nr:amidohydrolase family protein [Pseudoroseomonas cervicalis]EFH11394.1 amidohydrolase family protein [Pseudoroseomonas cervicalis ATCC 49957]
MPQDLLLKNIRPMGGAATDMLLRDGRIARIAPDQAVPGALVEDGAGALAIPGLVEAHTHLDKTLWGMGWIPNSAGPRLIDKIDNERRVKKELGLDAERQSGRQLVQSLRHGTTHIRTHVDIDTEGGLGAVEGVLRMRERYADVMDVELVAFPQSGLLVRPGTLELVDEALRLGCEVVGGLDPCGIDRDPAGHLDAVFALSQKHGKPLDIHLHEPGLLGAFSMELIFERTRALGMQGQVVVSHAFCLGDADAAMVNALLDEIAALDIGIMTTGSASRPVPAVAQLVARGIRVCSGNDGIRDSWGPYGNGDMLERAMMVGLRNNFRRDEEVAMALAVCTQGGAEIMRLKDYGLAEGCRADLVLVAAESVAEAVVAHPPRALVVKRGNVVARGGVALVEAP